MSSEKNGSQNERKTSSSCYEGIFKMMMDCCPDGREKIDCLTMMKEMREKFCGQKTKGDATDEARSSRI